MTRQMEMTTGRIPGAVMPEAILGMRGAKERIECALKEIFADLGAVQPEKLAVEEPKDAKFGDLSTNAALLLAKPLDKKPRDLAHEIGTRLQRKIPQIEKMEIAGPGFINITFNPDIWRDIVRQIEHAQILLCDLNSGNNKKVMVEYVSANPTGPLHVGHGRGAALGDSVARLLKAAGYGVVTEYYLNDAGRQMRTLGLSIWLRVLAASGSCPKEAEFPKDCYQGDYIKDLARDLLLEKPDLAGMSEDAGIAVCQAYGMEKILATIKSDLEDFGCRIDNFASENALVEKGAVGKALEHLAETGKSYEADGALWLDTTANGDDKNRVLRKSDGYLTYFATDIAYHHDKFARGNEWLIDVWGADHHGYIPRMKAAIADMGHDPGQLSVMLVQLVNLLRNGKAVSMSTRAGEFVTLAEVLQEVGRDAARFMFLSRSSDTPLDFDLELVKKRTMDNPVYYVQYAHARVEALMRRAKERGLELDEFTGPELLRHLDKPEEIAILRHMAAYEDTLINAAKNLAPHHMSKYLLDLAALMHSYYAKHKVMVEGDPAGTKARLALQRAAGKTLKNGLYLLGVSAPEAM